MSGGGNYPAGPGNKDTVYRDLLPTGAPDPGTPPPPPNTTTTPYNFGQYQTPTYGLTPQSGYTGLAQQLQQAFNLSPQSYAAPRTGLQDMFASPWGVIPGMNPNQQTLGQMYGQDPMQGRAAPPGTPQYLGINTPPGGAGAPPPPAPPAGQPNLPPVPGNSAPSAPYTPPVPPAAGTPPPPGSTPTGRGAPGMGKFTPGLDSGLYRNAAKNMGDPMNKGGMSLPPPPPGDFTTPDPGANYGYGGQPGGLMNNFAAMGGDVGRFGPAMAMMAQKRNEMFRTPGGLNDAQLFQAGKQGIDPRDMQNVHYQADQGGIGGQWQDRNTLQPYANQHDYFRATKNPGVYGK